MTRWSQINNRPEPLERVPLYASLPRLPFAVDDSDLPGLLKMDIFMLQGFLPHTEEISRISPFFEDTPSEEIIEYYEQTETSFQLVFVVVNCYGLYRQGDQIHGKPYSVSLVPASKREKVDLCDVHTAMAIECDRMVDQGLVYLGFDPFRGWSGLFGSFGVLLHEDVNDVYTDSIGFVIGAYYLADKVDLNAVSIWGPAELNPKLFQRYWRFRVRKYFRPFRKLTPRKVWGADSPIELFLIHGLAAVNLRPQVQTMVFDNGEVFPSLHDLVLAKSSADEFDLLTEIDLFFPDQGCAIFCDSTKHHRSKKQKQTDANVVTKLAKLGIRSLRIRGRDIVKNLDECVDRVIIFLENSSH